jgi:hypothetical protein
MTAFADYLAAIKKNLAHGDATEHTHRPALKTLLEAVDKGIIATNEPTRILCGAPDFNITRKKVPIGHVETKDVGTSLDAIERDGAKATPATHDGEQFKRYLTLPNWILTDYLEFRWFVGGEKRLTARIGEIDAKGKLKPPPDGEEKLAELLNAFFKQKALTIGTAKELAQRMAGMTRIIRDLIVNTFEHEKEQGWLHNWLAAFRETLIPDLEEAQFADMFAQTLAYGLFAARVHTPPRKEFSREMAAYNLPKTNPFLRKLFSEIAGVDMPETIDWAVDDIVELLKHADMFEILKDFGKGKGKEDPVVHFYETFLAAYDPKMREVRGVYYTPESPRLSDFITEFPAKGSNEVEKVQYIDKDKRVWVNAVQYFSGVPKSVWEFHIGGYQVCDKWLKDRKDRKLSYDDTEHYQKIVVALNETIRLISEIDKVIEAHGGWPIV